MFCEKNAGQGILYLYGELEPAAKQVFEAHLTACPQCQSEMALLKESKLFAQMLPLEEIAPVSYEKIVSSLKPEQSFFEKYIQPAWKPLRATLEVKRRLVLVPVGAAFLFLLLFYLFNPEFEFFKSSASRDSETVFAWEVGVGESLDELEQKIAQIKSENLFMEKAAVDSTFYASVDYSTDQHIAQIEANIQSLSSELSHLNF